MGWVIAHDGVRVTIVSCSEAIAMPSSLAAYMSSLDPPTPPRDPAFSQRKILSGNCEVCNKDICNYKMGSEYYLTDHA